MSSQHTSLPNTDVPEAVIGGLLGQGWGYEDWKSRLKDQGYGNFWNESIKNTIIKKEFEYFKTEILRLKAEPNEAKGGKDVPKTNSSESILKRLQGLEWAKGKPNEKAQRIRAGRLFGKDAKPRTLQKYVKEWKEMEPSSGVASNLDRDTTGSAYRSTKSRPSQAPTQYSMQHVSGSIQPTTQNAGWNDQSRELSAYPSARDAGAFSPAYQLDPQKSNSQPFISQPAKTSTSNPTRASASSSASTSMSTAKPNSTNSGNGYQTSNTWSTMPAARTNSLATKTASPPTNITSLPNQVGGYQSNITPAARTIPLATTTTSPSTDTLASANSVRGYQSSTAWSTAPVAQATPLVKIPATTSINTPNPPDLMGSGYQSRTASSNNAAARGTQQSTTNTANFQQGTYPTASPGGYSSGIQPYWDSRTRQWRY